MLHRLFSHCSEQGLPSTVAHQLLIAAPCLVVEHRLWGEQVSVVVVHRLCCTWDLPGPGVEPASPALAGRSFTTRPPG